MFTGIVEERGRVREAGRRLVVECSTVSGDAGVGSSIAVSGVCLTVAERRDGALAFDLTEETLARTTLGSLQPGGGVNLERPVTLAGRLGGHLVQGHVDGVGTVEAVDGDRAILRVRPADGLARYVVGKGSVAVDGVSLTVSSIKEDGTFTVALVPHTLQVTTLGELRPGDRVNLEVDVVAKYVEALLTGRPA
ncbi:MAG TPA: riboflavin synthase [Actinomycetota bacterium]|nr:riboflavin synthase [Actinomycetota bacterium]